MPEVRLIDANALLHSMCCLDGETQCDTGDCIRYKERKYIEAAPTIKAEPVRHGQWIEKPPYADETVKGLEFQIVCSRCDEQNSSITFDENSVPIAKTFYRTRYCPNCGARMDATDTNVGGKGGADNG